VESSGAGACSSVGVSRVTRGGGATSGIGFGSGTGVGSGSGGTRGYGSLELEISSDYIRGRDPSDVFNRCVLRRSGQMPVRVLADQPGWRG